MNIYLDCAGHHQPWQWARVGTELLSVSSGLVHGGGSREEPGDVING